MDEDERPYSDDSDAAYEADEDEVEYEGDDDDENQDEEDGQEEESESRAEPGPEVASYAAAQSLGPIFSPDMVEAYADQMGMTTEQIGVAAQFVQHLMEHNNAADSITNAVIAREAEHAPQFFTEYGNRIRQHLSRIPAEQRSQRKMVQVASVLAYLESASDNDDLPTIIGGLARRLNARRAAPEREREREREPERPRIPPERRNPQPAAAARSAPPSPSRPRGKEEATRGFMARFGLDPIYEREVQHALKTKTGWR